MATATVELTFDRRRSERRRRAESVEAERRQGDRRRHHVEAELAPKPEVRSALSRRPVQVDPLRTADYGTSTKWPEMVRVLD